MCKRAFAAGLAAVLYLVADAPPFETPCAAAGKLWSPKGSSTSKSKSKAKTSGDAEDGDTSREEEELLRPRNAPPPPPASRPRRRIKADTAIVVDATAVDDEQAEDGEEEDDDEDGGDGGVPSLPPVLPRLGVLAVGASALGRSFHYDAALQGDSSLARVGYAISLETFPLLRTPRGFHRRLGVGGTFEHQSGSASLVNATDGTTVSYPLTQSRWAFDLRAFFPIGARVVVLPALGYGHADANLGARMGTLPSGCLASSTRPCVADAAPSYLTADVHVRVAASAQLSFSLVAGYLLGAGVANGVGQIASSEATAKMQGVHVDVGGRYLLRDWFGLEVQLPYRRYGYALTPAAGSAATYRAAVDSYYGLVAGVALLSP